MRYEEIQPEPSLRPWVDRFWLLEGRTAAPAEGVLPDGCPEIVLSFGDPFRRVRSDGSSTVQPSAMLVGQITGPMTVGGTGRVDLVGVRLRPAGAHALLGLPMSRLTDDFVELGGVATWWEEVRERLGQIDSAARRIPLLQELLARRVPAGPGHDPVAAAVELLWRTHGGMAIDDVARAVNLGPRQLSRRFGREVGVGPKALAGIRRFQRFLTVATGPAAEPLARAAVAAGYFDQAHLTRDFNRLAGSSPGRFLARRHDLADLFADADLRRADGDDARAPAEPTGSDRCPRT